MKQTSLGGAYNFPGTTLSVHRIGYGAMQLAGPHVFGPPRDRSEAVAVLREAIASGVNHIDTSDFYGPHVTNELSRRLCALTRKTSPLPQRSELAVATTAPGSSTVRAKIWSTASTTICATSASKFSISSISVWVASQRPSLDPLRNL